MLVVVCVCLLLSGFVSSAECTPLDDYVKKSDPSYEWQEILSPVRMDNYTVYYLNMTSQTWLSCACIGFCSLRIQIWLDLASSLSLSATNLLLEETNGTLFICSVGMGGSKLLGVSSGVKNSI